MKKVLFGLIFCSALLFTKWSFSQCPTPISGAQCPVGTGQLLPWGTIFFDESTCTVQVDYWLKNTTSTTSNVQVAFTQSIFEWDSSFFSFVSFQSYAQNLNLPDYFDAKKSNGNDCFSGQGPDREEFSTRNEPAKGLTNWRKLTGTRSTNQCSNVFDIPCQQSRPIASIVLQLRDCSVANWSQYHWTTNSTDPQYVAEINNDTLGPTSIYRKIMIVVNKETRGRDASGANCPLLDKCTEINTTTVCLQGGYIESTNAPLPVLLTSFNARKRTNDVALEWVSAQEIDNAGFEIQRKSSSGEFKTIAFVPTKANGGNSSSDIQYKYVDADALDSKVVYYRIKQVDIYQKWGFSSVKAVRVNPGIFDVLIYPNPGYGKLNIILPQSNDKYSLGLVDISGRLVKKMEGIKTDNVQLNDVKRGIYFLQVVNMTTREKITEKLVVY